MYLQGRLLYDREQPLNFNSQRDAQHFSHSQEPTGFTFGSEVELEPEHIFPLSVFVAGFLTSDRVCADFIPANSVAHTWPSFPSKAGKDYSGAPSP